MLASSERCFAFGPLRLVPGRRALFADGRPVAIHGRAFDLLAVLVEHRDRVVGRDELLARVWPGTTVSDNNIAVQIAALRRALVANGIDPQAIVNVPGRGYQFVADVVERLDAPGIEADAETEVPAHVPSRAGRRVRRRLRWPLVAAALVALIVAATALLRVDADRGRAEDLRLTIGLRPLDAVGPAPAVLLAGAYTAALRTRRRWMEDFRIYPSDRAPDGRRFHFILSGSVQIVSGGALLSYTLLTSEGELVAGGADTVPGAPTRADLLQEATAIFRDIAPHLFRVEAARRRGPPRDATDLVIAAQAACAEYDRPDRVDEAIGFAERAVALDPRSVAGSLLLADVLVARMSLRPAQDGDADGRRALVILDDLLTDEPNNAGALQTKASDLVELGEPALAASVATLGLTVDPGSPLLLSTLLDADEEGGRFAEADALVAGGRLPPDSGNVAQLAFAEGRYRAALGLLDQYLAVASVELERRLMTLLKVAALVRTGSVDEAARLLRQTVDRLPLPFRTIAGLRRTYYELPPDAWTVFEAALARAGMATLGPAH